MAGEHFIAESDQLLPLLSQLLDTTHQGVSVIDKDFKLLLANQRAVELLDLPQALLDGTYNFADMIAEHARRGYYGPGDPEEVARERIAILKNGEAHDLEKQHADGTVLRLRGTPLENGGFMTIVTDVTIERAAERYLAENRDDLAGRLEVQARDLKASHDLLSSAVDAIPDGLVMTDRDGVLTLANDAMKRLFPEIEGHIRDKRTIASVIPLGSAAARTVDHSEGVDKDAFFEHVAVESDHRMFANKWIRVQSSPVSHGGHIVVFADISDFKKQNKTLRAHADQLVKHLRKEKRLNEMQREFVSMASHEFRTPLAIIDGAAQRLKRRIDRLEPLDVLERVTRIRDAVGRMQYLIDRFIDSSGAHSGNMEIEPTLQPLDALLGAICRQQAQVHTSHRIETSFDIDGVVLNIDRRMIEQCVLNVLGNAIKYSPGGDRIEVKAHVEGRYVEIRVSDFGVGIPKNEISKIFGRYFRASTSSGIPGTGIGLNLTEMVMEQHHGKIEVESTVGEGTTVVLKLPYAQDEAIGAQADSGALVVKTAAAGAR
ncbi:PAS-domain containing protein [Breoghania sp. L-A4]|uniref:sensor histidine kinase n=1 Tax=Breoghania sp. L-A4 TaxID=2304600 RepID=UPI000E359B3A|nr:PAS-domain containing protein [Breoghania sp. L-A4]AXS40898.1 PAS domain-containing protein [Breoghania sp. L-A4]